MDRVGDLLRQSLQRMVPTAKQPELRACMAWAQAVGPDIAERTWPVRVDDCMLVVATTNAVWAAELGYLAEELTDRVNEEVGEEAIRGVRFVVRPARDHGG